MTALRKVLVVDDDPVVTTSFDRVLSHEGYVVVTARNGTEALDKLNSGEYDVVYTDIRMPGMDGLELAERVKARRSWTPVVIITGYGSEANERRAKAAGVNAFLHKPLSPEMIETSAKEAVESAPPAVAPAAPAAPMAAPAAAPRPAEPEAATAAWKTIGLLLAGPLLGLAYIVLLPFVGLALLAGLAVRRFLGAGGLRGVARFLKNVALFVAAPFIGLAYIVMLPFVGFGAFVWVAVSGMVKKQRSE
jgi:CheY-like chemotaxis protein